MTGLRGNEMLEQLSVCFMLNVCSHHGVMKDDVGSKEGGPG